MKRRPPSSPLFPYPPLFRSLLRGARFAGPLCPRPRGAPVPGARAAHSTRPWPSARHARRVLLLPGCVQPAVRPAIDAAAARVLDRVGSSTVAVDGTGCCGALAHHLSAHRETLHQMRRNVDALWPHIEAGAEAVVVTASACASMLSEYGRLLRDDPDYAARAARVAALARDIAQVAAAESEGLTAALRRAAHRQGPGMARGALHAAWPPHHALPGRG